MWFLNINNRAERLLKKSGLFDEAFYIANNQDIKEMGINPVRHFLKCGGFEGRKPCAEFDPVYYLRRNSDVKLAGMNPLLHYILCGEKEGRWPSSQFDPDYYKNNNPDIGTSGMGPLCHYKNIGKGEGRLPCSNNSQDLCNGRTSSIEEYEEDLLLKLDGQLIKPIAFYLPQYHPIPENDAWWGKGFTEWTNVSKARPLFQGHHQPRLPGELGFYDLRVPEIMKRQIELAKTHGVYGFCFYHYWFAGKRLLERPVNLFFEKSEWVFPFCLCWANENWTRRWDGMEKEILIAQEYSPEDDLAFIRDIEKYVRDVRYIKVSGKPLIILYNAQVLPNAGETARCWRDYCRKVGIGEIFLAIVQTFGAQDPRPFGFDAAIEFPPHTLFQPKDVQCDLAQLDPAFEGRVHAYSELALSYPPLPQDFLLFKGITLAWDNTARRGKDAYILADCSPKGYQEWLENLFEQTIEHHQPEHRFVFINAWNEWAEGTHLEPDRKYGYAYLNATTRALQKFCRQ
jgi:hypothetical protein